MARMSISAETRRQLNGHDRRWPIKLGLRALAVPLAFIAMILFAVTTSVSKMNYGGNDWTDGLPLAPVLLALFYDPLVLFLTLFQRHGRPIHPGWNVGVDFLVWGLAIPSLVFSVGDGWFWYWQPVLVEFDGMVPCDEYNYWSQICNPLIYTLGRIEIAANVFLALILIIHFTLFVYACIATHKWRKAKKLTAAERRNIELQYNRTPEEHRESQPPAYTPSAKGSARMPVSAVSEEDNPFKDAEASAESNPFHDEHRSAVKYA
ncbi:hypothetical protein HO173_001663 [Letharia columbiana]|uniref:Uncharacterized protein n=1 Tax=Letharia columbiana TaxID=112416 RepID=A0A8H6G3V6_9LECA|nr:uncharacterized protein HO173_001663 [Letharia columbiana]KAF6240053.1 hypothetical protein HO173_001663 [Letharia columbiana]